MWKVIMFIVLLSNCYPIENKHGRDENIISLAGNNLEQRQNDSIDFKKALEKFNNKETKGRQHILYELNEKKYPEIKSLLETALEDEDESVKIISIQLIRDNKQIESIELLIRLFQSTNHNTIISNLCRTFADFKLEQPIPFILQKLKSENEMIVYDCIWTLGEIGTRSEIEILQRWVSDSRMPKIYDDNGFLSQSTQFSLGEMAKRSIEKIEKRI